MKKKYIIPETSMLTVALQHLMQNSVGVLGTAEKDKEVLSRDGGFWDDED